MGRPDIGYQGLGPLAPMHVRPRQVSTVGLNAGRELYRMEERAKSWHEIHRCERVKVKRRERKKEALSITKAEREVEELAAYRLAMTSHLEKQKLEDAELRERSVAEARAVADALKTPRVQTMRPLTPETPLPTPPPAPPPNAAQRRAAEQQAFRERTETMQLQARLKALDFEMHRAEDEKIKAAFIAKAYSRKKYPVTGIFKERFGEEYPHHPR